jgi:histidine ammonia-lyase
VTVILTGLDLSLDELVRVAREAEGVELAEDAIERMAAARAVAERAIAGHATVYGITTGVGVRKLFPIEASDHDRLLIRQHLIGQGASAPRDAVRATTLRLANGLASGRTTARPELAAHVIRALNDDRLPPVRLLGSIGISDLAPLADLAEGILDGFELKQGEAIALLNQGAFSTGIAALALHDALTLLDALDLAGALDYEAFAANRDALHPAIGVARPSAGLQSTLARVSGLLEGSGAEARALQDPLSFRTLAQLHGATRDAFGFVRAQVEFELNAAQSNPLVLTDEDRMISVGNFEIQSLATALDLARLALAPALSSAAERTVKLLQTSLTGLSEGLGARPGLAESALSEYGIAVQAFASEARLLAQPVSLDLVSTTQAEGIEDRMTMTPLAARRLGEMVELGARVVSVELLLAAQACDLRGAHLGDGTARVHRAVRNVVPFVGEGEPLPDLDPLVTLIRSGRLGD